TRSVIVRLEVFRMKGLPWVESPEAPEGCQVFSWRDWRPEERRRIEEDIIRGLIPTRLTPFQEERLIEPEISLGVRCRGEVAGWIVVHRVKPDTTQVGALFVRPEYRGLGLGRLMSGTSMNRQIKARLPHRILMVEIENEEMLHIQRRHNQPGLVHTAEFRQARKDLRGPGRG
ncbi:MAG: GNAT family N-acetyltransferase, partial [Thermodesulfobacteriota bacterium]